MTRNNLFSSVDTERLECEVLQKVRYINTLTFTFTFRLLQGVSIYIPWTVGGFKKSRLWCV